MVLLGAVPARAGIVSATPSLPVLGVAYSSSVGAGCFPAAGVCITAGTITLTSLVSSSFNAQGQDIVTQATYAGTLTTLTNIPIGPVSLTGTVEQQVFGRTFSTQTGTWATELLALSLSGQVLGGTLDMILDAQNPSTGQTSIAPIDDSYLIDSDFDVFVDLTLDFFTTPLHATRGPIHIALPDDTDAVAVLEPSGLGLLVSGLLGFVLTRRRGLARTIDRQRNNQRRG